MCETGRFPCSSRFTAYAQLTVCHRYPDGYESGARQIARFLGQSAAVSPTYLAPGRTQPLHLAEKNGPRFVW
jgi:hypothetical protein